MMRLRRCRSAATVFTFVCLTQFSPADAQLWKRFVPTTRIEADPSAEYTLTEDNGPWLIMAATFSGDGAEDQARKLVLEFRSKYNLPSYLHRMAFEFSDEQTVASKLGAPTRRRYRREGDLQFGVLVGDFASVDDPAAQELLDRVKRMQPEALAVGEGGRTAQTLVQMRAFQDAVMSKFGAHRQRGPMGQAFIARNPLLPREYFVPKGVDDFVAKMNEGVEHSLLDCPGKHTVRIATFRGRTILQTSAMAGGTATRSRRKHDADDALVEAAENAHLLTEELRAHGWEAYEFHDRTESIVTIGSFDQVLQQSADGRQVTTPAVHHIVQTFGAAYDTPDDPISGIGNDPNTQRDVARAEQDLKQQLKLQQTPMVQGLSPKHVKIMRRRGGKLTTERIIPIDIYPEAVEVPKRSISSMYAR
jgi:hypothetical protein